MKKWMSVLIGLSVLIVLGCASTTIAHPVEEVVVATELKVGGMVTVVAAGTRSAAEPGALMVTSTTVVSFSLVGLPDSFRFLRLCFRLRPRRRLRRRTTRPARLRGSISRGGRVSEGSIQHIHGDGRLHLHLLQPVEDQWQVVHALDSLRGHRDFRLLAGRFCRPLRDGRFLRDSG